MVQKLYNPLSVELVYQSKTCNLKGFRENGTDWGSILSGGRSKTGKELLWSHLFVPILFL